MLAIGNDGLEGNAQRHIAQHLHALAPDGARGDGDEGLEPPLLQRVLGDAQATPHALAQRIVDAAERQAEAPGLARGIAQDVELLGPR